MTINRLTSDQLDELMARYYSGENIALLIKEFRLVIAPNAIHSLFPNRLLEEMPCPFCGTVMEQPLPSRSALRNGSSFPSPYCSWCGHEERDACQCAGCCARQRSLLVQALEQRRVSIRRREGQGRQNASLQSASLRDVVDVVALCRAGRYENTDNISALIDQVLPLCCTSDWQADVALRLHDLGYIDVGDLSIGIDWQPLEEVDGHLDLDIDLIPWKLSLGKSCTENIEILSSYEQTLRCASQWNVGWETELQSLWHECALDEVLAYFSARLHQHGFVPRIGDKTRQVFSEILDHFSVYEAYNFVWAAVKNAAAYKLRTNVSGRHAANTIVGYCQQRAERAVAEKWSIKPYRRDPSIPVSVRSSLFANVVTKLGERFYSDSPGDTAVLSESANDH